MSIIALDISCAVNAAKWGFFQGSYGPGTVPAPSRDKLQRMAKHVQDARRVWAQGSNTFSNIDERYLVAQGLFCVADVFVNYLLDARGVSLMVGASGRKFEPPIDERVRAQYRYLSSMACIFTDWLIDAQVISLLVRSAYDCDDVQFDDLVHCSERRRASQFCDNCDGGGWVFDEDNRYKRITCPICHGDGAI